MNEVTLLKSNQVAYKPLHYPWAYEAYLTQQRIHWLPEEVPMGDDVKDWKTKLTDEEKNLLTHIFRFFTQADVEVSNCYNRKYAGIFKPNEVQMMLTAFSNMESIHVDAYSHLIDTLQMPETTYTQFMEYKEMQDKYDYMQKFNTSSKEHIATTLAAFGAFTEGVQLFASFAMLLNFPRFNKMKGMGQIVTWSVRDETLHFTNIIKLFRTLMQENPDIDREFVKTHIYKICEEVVTHEDKFIDLAFELGGIEGMTSYDIKRYIRYIADRRLEQLGYDKLFLIDKMPIPWLNEILNGVEHANFFEARATEYSKAGTTGEWPTEY